MVQGENTTLSPAGTSPEYSLGQDTGYPDIRNYKNVGLSADVGIGAEFKLRKYAIAPELSFSNGLINAFRNNGTSYSNPSPD
jgi:hypothetical protein